MIIAISGKKHSGKSTVAAMLSEELGWEVTSFAKKLKEITCVLSGCTMEQLEDYDFKENTIVPTYLWAYCSGGSKPTYRSFMQWFGTEVMRKRYGNIWIEATLENAPSDVIVSDCRFINEAEAITDYNGVIIRVISPLGSSDDLHCSELEIEDIKPDVIIWNYGNLDELRDKIKELANDVINCTVKKEY